MGQKVNPVGLRLGSETIDIPAGEREHVIADRYVLLEELGASGNKVKVPVGRRIESSGIDGFHAHAFAP